LTQIHKPHNGKSKLAAPLPRRRLWSRHNTSLRPSPVPHLGVLPAREEDRKPSRRRHLHLRPSSHRAHRDRRVPGGGHPRPEYPHHQAQFPGPIGNRAPGCDSPCLSHCLIGTARSGSRRCALGSAEPGGRVRLFYEQHMVASRFPTRYAPDKTSASQPNEPPRVF
jgi:hypothetical protein